MFVLLCFTQYEQMHRLVEEGLGSHIKCSIWMLDIKVKQKSPVGWFSVTLKLKFSSRFHGRLTLGDPTPDPKSLMMEPGHRYFLKSPHIQ